MPKLQVGSAELVDAEAEFVSLVKRGANRIPFRITKEDTQDMIDLSKIGRTLFKHEAPKPAVIAVIAQKGVNTERLAQVFKAADLDPQTFVKKDEEGVVTLTKQDVELGEDTVVLKMNDEIAIAVSGLKKTFDGYSYTMTDFDAVLRTEGVYPMMYVAEDALSATISNILYKAASPGEAADMVGQAIDSFRNYMTGILGDVPVTAFKMEAELQKCGSLTKDATPLGDEPPVETDVEKEDGEEGEGSEDVEKTELEADNDLDKGGMGKKKKAGKGKGYAMAKDGEEEADEVEKTGEAASGDLPAVIEAVTTQMQTLFAAQQETIQKQLDAVVSQVAALDGKVNTAVAKFDGAVFLEDEGDPAPVKKSEGAGAPPLLDTAYTGNRRRA